MPTRLAITLVLSMMLAVPAGAAAFGGSLSGSHFAQSWDDLSPQQRERALQNYNRFKSLPPDKQRDVEERYQRWKNLPNADKDRYRRKYGDTRRDD